MITKFVAIMAVVFGLTFAVEYSAAAQPTCCAKRAYCCATKAKCCNNASAAIDSSSMPNSIMQPARFLA